MTILYIVNLQKVTNQFLGPILNLMKLSVSYWKIGFIFNTADIHDEMGSVDSSY